MSLKDWKNNGWLRDHKTSANEIANLFKIVDRDIADGGTSAISDDWQFGIAYNAALKLCTIALYSEGYRPENTLAHYRTLMSLPMTLGEHHKDDAVYLDACRIKRNTVEYDSVSGASHGEAQELLDFVRELRAEVLVFLKKHHPELSPKNL